MAVGFVSFRHVYKRYKSFVALHDVSFSLNEGEVFGYIGPNGAGKTTTLKLLVGLLRDFEGEIQIGGLHLPRDAAALHEMVGYLPQYPDFHAWRSVDEALMTLGRLSGVPVLDLQVRIPQLLERFGLGDVRYKKVKKLSGGMKQKVGFVQALLHNPKLLVLDEPLSGLDPEARMQFKEQIQALKSEGVTVIFSSHILADIQDVADKLGFIYEGQFLKAGTVPELCDYFDIPLEVVVRYAVEPSSVDFLHQVRGLQDLRRLGSDGYLLSLVRGVEIDAIVHHIVSASMAGGGQIRFVGEQVPNLDDLYRRFLERAKQMQQGK